VAGRGASVAAARVTAMTDMERPDADVLDQQREERPAYDEDVEQIDELPIEANEADLVEQHRVVPLDDE
jgi:hypothetical protein